MSGRKHIQILAAVAASLGMTTTGFGVSLSSFAIPQLLDEDKVMELTEDETSWFASVYVLGSVTGSLLGGYTCQKIGRRRSMLLDAVLFLVGLLILGLAPMFPLLLVGRFITGHAAGSNLVTIPIFVGETSHPSIRGLTGALLIILYCFGFTLSMFLGALFAWRNVVLIATIFPVVSFLLLFFMKDSPTWLSSNGNPELAFQSMFFYRGDEDMVREELNRIKDNIRRIEKQNEADGNSTYERFKNKIRRTVDPSFLKPFLLLNVMLNVGLEWGGFPALAFYMHTILKEVDVPFDEYWVAVMLSAYRTVVAVSLSFILVKVPRRPMYLFSGSLVVLALATQAGYAWLSPLMDHTIKASTNWIPLAAILLQYTGFGLGYGVIVYNLQGEILPSDMRSFGSGLLGITDNIFLFAVVKITPFLKNSIGIGGMFCTFCCCSLFNLVICYFIMPETKDMSLEDIEDFYTANKQAAKIKKELEKV